MKILAHLYAYQESDVLPWVVRHLFREGVDVLITDNHSTDGTWAIAQNLAAAGAPRIRATRWPETGPVDVVSWHTMLRRIEEIALQARADGYNWVIHHDADEIRRSRVPGERLVDAIARLDAEGYTAIDHEVRVYRPREGWDGSQDPELWFRERLADQIDMHNPQVKAWKQPDVRVDLASMAGHAAQFPGCRVAPEKLVLNHYPLRSRAQAARKIASRAARWAEEDRAKGWHIQYQGTQT